MSTGSKIILRDWHISDAPQLARILNNKKIQDNLRDGISFPYTEKDASDFINSMIRAEKNSQYAFAITYKRELVGSIAAFRQSGVYKRSAEIGYYIAELHWGKGIMTEAVVKIRDYVFENTDIVRIFAQPYSYNKSSCRVLEKSGFQFEGKLRRSVIKNNNILDTSIYSAVKPEILS